MAYSLSLRSRTALQGVHPDLVAVVKRAIQITRQDFVVLQGVRTTEQMYETYGQGRTVAQCIAKKIPPEMAERYAKPREAKVTWLDDPLMSNHRVMADGFGHAVDICPYPVDWKTPSKFDAIALAMMTAAVELNVSIRWGADWNQNGKPREKGETDSPHFEIYKRR